MSYNGWKNYETWNVALWIDNGGDQAYFAERAQEIYDEATADRINTREQAATHELADEIKDQFETSSQDMLDNAGQSSSVWADLLGAALSEVDWHEIAEHFIDETDKDEDEDEDEPSEPDEDDITTEDHRTFYQSGKVYLTVDEDQDYKQALRDQMQRDQFWPNVWFISDHGNAHLMSLDGE